MVDPVTLQRLLEALELKPTDRVIEIGAGFGALTRELVDHVQEVVAIEIDPAAVRALSTQYKDASNLRIVQGDVLSQDVGALLGPPYRVLGNIPYNITGALLPQLMGATPSARQVDLVLQREVADRIASPPGGWSLATLAVRIYGTAQLRLIIPSNAFYPEPKVDSALLRIVPDRVPALPTADLPLFFRFAAPFFQARRKQLPFTLSRLVGVGREEARSRLLRLGIEPSRRAETLSVDEWKALFDAERADFKPDMIRAAP
jgi:16S rRNA (adenine1518-N6/adenine1519-N6)-dimethyltransferase